MIGVIAFLGAHWVSIAAWSWLGLTAVGATMPEMRPRTLDDFYHWGYDAVHQFANLKNQRPTLPAATSGNLKQQ
jgi:hypothetical protein